MRLRHKVNIAIIIARSHLGFGAKSTSCNSSEFLSARTNGNAHSTGVWALLNGSFNARTCTRAAYSSEASQADPELVPGVNTCTLNNREFLAIIERRAGPGRFRCASPRAPVLLLSPHYVTSPARAASCSARVYGGTGVAF